MSNIRRNSPNYKMWKRRNDEKNFRSRIRRNRKRKQMRIKKEKINKNVQPFKTFSVPKVFSIIKNPEETIQFLNEIIKQVEAVKKINQKQPAKLNFIREFLINMDDTMEITGDALMYLLTIIKNTRGKRILPINWRGTFPKDENVKAFLKNSGYLKYMKTAKENLIKTNEHVQIKVGQGYEYMVGNKKIDIRQEIIDFTCDKLNKNKTQVNFLMTMLTEMITNIKDHAYDEVNLFEHCWYIFVENNANKISYTFMDNGLGIPTTIKKNAYEKMKEKLNLDKDYKYIEAGVSGLEKRSKTGKIERGNGLPSIYEQYTSNKVKKLVIISNKAYYEENNTKDLENNLNGTIFYWEIEKEAVK